MIIQTKDDILRELNILKAQSELRNMNERFMINKIDDLKRAIEQL